MTDRLPVDRAGTTDDGQTPERNGPGRWLLTWAGIFSMVILTAIIFIVAAFIVAN